MANPHPCPNPRGRPVGSKNKRTLTIEGLVQAVVNSFEKLGGEKWLIDLAAKDPKAYTSVLNKVIPSKVETTEKHKEPQLITMVYVSKPPEPPAELKDEIETAKTDNANS